jgi:hypothetical protein
MTQAPDQKSGDRNRPDLGLGVVTHWFQGTFGPLIF